MVRPLKKCVSSLKDDTYFLVVEGEGVKPPAPLFYIDILKTGDNLILALKEVVFI